jgi:biopolymer transport protein ExbD
MIRAAQKQDSQLASLELTPLIDIVFIVIVFLLITANAPLLELPVNIPETEEKQQTASLAEAMVLITIIPESPHWVLDGKPYKDWDVFKQALIEALAREDARLSIAADKAAPVEPLLKLLAFLTDRNIADAHIVMKEEGL